ncbi:MAG: DUF922 domain-containing protein [Fulvivirga sp.]
MFNIILFVLIANLAPTEYDGMIFWQEGRTIDWADFKGAPNPSSPFDAEANSGVRYTYTFTTQGSAAQVNFEVHSFFNAEQSWIKSQKQTDLLLEHEQLHFDISELHARKLKKAFGEYHFSKSPKKEIEKIFNKINKERAEMQVKYDHESDHSKNKLAQAKWKAFVKAELSTLSRFQ